VIRRDGLGAVPAAHRALALGTFDGVHLGHRAVIERTIEAARERSIGSCVVTFDPHPMRVLRPEVAPSELTTLDRKAALLDALGVDELVVIRFDHELSQLGHEAFEREVLAEALGAELVIVGENFRYGHRAQGSVETLRSAGERLGYAIVAAPLRQIDGAPVSSSRIRDLFAAGAIHQATELLGRPPSVEGVIVHGDGRGRALGFATANLAPAAHSALPARGVYAGRAHLPGRSRPAAISVGFNPTFSDARDAVRIEAHLLHFDEDVYGSPLRLDFAAKLRDEAKYGSVEELVEQVQRDIDQVRVLAGSGQLQGPR
jgi:riboflavin kinase / FMN adenylyltransferase